MAWNRPSRLSEAAAESWLRRELRQLVEVPEVESVVLTRVEKAPRRQPWDWVCELQLAAGADADAVCSDWLLDLRLLGMRPVFAVLGTGQEVI